MNQKNVLVTGGAGYIGSHTCKELKKSGYLPIVFDNLSTGRADFVKWGPFFHGDLLNRRDLSRVFQEYQIDTVMHFAGKAYVHESVRNPLEYYKENIGGAVNLLDIFIRNNGKKFVFSSSCATYGESTSTFINEEDKQDPVNPYGFTKLAVEQLILNLKFVHGFNYAILRYFNAAGADEDLEIGELHEPETHVIPLMIQALRKSEEFQIFGSDYDTADGTAIRDYTHVSDLAEAHISSLNYISESRNDLICNLGSGNGVSTLGLARKMKELKPEFKYKYAERRKGDPSRLVADNSRSRERLGLSYQKSNIENILHSAISWNKTIAPDKI
jgi:UDP-glucose-4-epimerase GalE